MPHDKNGTPLTVGDRVTVLGSIKSITSDQPEFCNINFLTDIGMAADQPGYELALSARMVEKLPLSSHLSPLTPPPQPPPQPVPYLYVEGFGPSNPVVLSGALGNQFVWEPAIGRHIHRFASIEDFNARSRDVIEQEQMWKVFVGVEAAADALPSDQLSVISDQLKTEQGLNTALLKDIEKLDQENVALMERLEKRINERNALTADLKVSEEHREQLLGEINALREENAKLAGLIPPSIAPIEPAPVSTEQPPVDNTHVAEGAEQFPAPPVVEAPPAPAADTAAATTPPTPDKPAAPAPHKKRR